MSLDLCAGLVVYIDCRWNCMRVYYLITIVGGIAVVFSSL